MWFRGKGGPDEPNISNAEWDLYVRCQKGKDQGELLEGPFGERYIPFPEEGFQTKPDDMFPVSMVAVYVDGPYHDGKQGERDKRINTLLEAKGWKWIRFKHNGYASQTTIESWYRKIVDAVNPRYQGRMK